MTSHARAAIALLGSLVAIVLVGCTGDAAPDAPEPDSTASVETATPVTVERIWGQTAVEITVHPVQTDGELARLTVEFVPAAAAGSQGVNLWLTLDSVGTSQPGYPRLRLIDPEAFAVSPIGTTGDGEFAAERIDPAPNAGATTTTTLHAAPAGESVDVLIPSFGFVPDVPVVSDQAAVREAVASLGGNVQAQWVPLHSYATDWDEQSRTDQQGDTVTVTLTSDVLFDTGSATLSAAAIEVVSRAAEQVRALADEGAVRVVGHTDDVDDEAYNLQLSADRAVAVAEELRNTLDSAYEMTTEGMGESSPIAPGTSAEARAANRRVEIIFTRRSDPSVQQGGTLPPTDLPTAAGNDPVEVTVTDHPEVLRVDSVIRRDGMLIGTLLMDGHGHSGSGVFGNLLGVWDRQFDLVKVTVGVHKLTVITPAERIFPLEYTTGEGEDIRRSVLGDIALDVLPNTGTVQVTVIWPDTGADAISIQSDEFRIENIPVTDG